jgi:hypothetical protein
LSERLNRVDLAHSAFSKVDSLAVKCSAISRLVASYTYTSSVHCGARSFASGARKHDAEIALLNDLRFLSLDSAECRARAALAA